jgi:hypothetical protein
MRIHVVLAEIKVDVWRAVKAFLVEEEADEYAEKIYEDGYVGEQRVLDSRVDEVNLED